MSEPALVQAAEWSASAAALALSQSGPRAVIEPAAVDRVIAWLHRVSLKQTGYRAARIPAATTTHTGAACMPPWSGVLIDDQELFRWGLGRYALAIDQISRRQCRSGRRHEQALQSIRELRAVARRR